MNKTPIYAAETLDLVFFGQPILWASRSNALILSLHSGPAIDAAGKITNLLTYPEYESQRLPRNHLTWRRTDTTVRNLKDVRFPLNQTGVQTSATHWAMTPEGETKPRYNGKFECPLPIGPGERPLVLAGHIQFEET